MKQVITITTGRQVTLGQYAKAWKMVKSVPPETVFKHGLTCWWPCTAADILKQYTSGLHDRINIRGQR